MDGYLFFLGCIISGTIIYLIKEYKRREKNEKRVTSKSVQSRKENLNNLNLKSFQNIASTNELVKNETPYDPIINGDFLTDDILDEKFKNIATYNLELIKSKNSQKELYRIKFEKIFRLIESIDLSMPKDKSRKDKRLLIQYLKKVNKPIKTISYRELLVLERDYLFPILNKKDEYGWEYEITWILGLIPTILIEIMIWFLINLILSSFTNFQFYYIPIFTAYYLIKSLLNQRRKRVQGKIW